LKGRLFIAVSLLASSVSCAFAVDLPATVAPPSIQAGSWVLMDYTTGQVLTAGNEHQQRNPASLTKLMTGYVVDRAIDSHRIPGTYVRPHRHPHTFELLLPLRGRFVVLNFDDRGTVTHRAILGETCTVLEMAAGTWHAVLSLDTGGIIFEVKHGGYQPVAADDYAHWAPAEGEPGTTELMAWYAQAQVGDSTFAV
ncbi:D-alanyl-D-alanine carboxypeptidase DacD, partial [Klebsiella pneumoniae]